MRDWIRRLFGSSPACRAARDHLAARQPEWQVWTGIRSHRATEDARTVVAVFFQTPDRITRPPRYKLFAVGHDSGDIVELPTIQDSPYRLGGYR